MEALLIFLFAIIAAILFNVAVFLEKIGVDKMPKLTEGFSLKLLRQFITNVPWITGMLLGIVGGVFYMTAMAEGNLSLIQVIANWGIIVLVILSVKYLGERLTPMEWAGILVSLAGVTLVAITFEKSTPHPFDWMTYILTIGVLMVIGIGMYIYGLKGKKGSEVGFGLAAGSMFSVGAISTKALTVVVLQYTGEFNLMSRVTWSALKYPDVIGLIIVLALANIVGFAWFQVGIQAGRATIVGSVNGVTVSVIPIIAGVLIFGESLLATMFSGILQYTRIAGIILTLGGTAVMYVFSAEMEQKFAKTKEKK